MRKRNNIENAENTNTDIKFVDIIQAQRITALGRTTVDNIAKNCGARHKVGTRVLYEVEPLLNAIRKM